MANLKSAVEKSSFGSRNIEGDFEHLRSFTGPPVEFWPEYLAGCANMVNADTGLLFVQDSSKGTDWKNLSIWPSENIAYLKNQNLFSVFENIASEASNNGYFWADLPSGNSVSEKSRVLGVRQILEDPEHTCVLITLFSAKTKIDPENVLTLLKLVSDTPAVYQRGRIIHKARTDVLRFSESMDLMVLMNGETRFMAAAMLLCNELASRYRCERVSLGWSDDEYVRVQAISHLEKFEKKMDAVQNLETVMEEAFDQDEEIVWPCPAGNTSITRDHELYSREQAVEYLVSIPLRIENNPVAVITCERSNDPFSEDEILDLRLICDQVVRRLGDLKKYDRWFGARFAGALKEKFELFLGPEHTFAKILGIIICIALGILLFGKMDYRVEGTFILKSDDLAYLPASFEGYINEVKVKPGDLIKKDDVLLTLDTTELLLEESNAIANKTRYIREAEKARAKNSLAEMKISQALADQAQAQLDLVLYRLKQANVKAPFNGIVVEGDLKEMLGAPVKKGDVLFKIALLDKMYTEINVDERDIHEIQAAATGEIAFVSRPNLKYPIAIERVDPLAITKDKGNFFVVRGRLTNGKESWWRPGMSGIAKINAGKRNIFWIVTHRTIDFLRILLWW